MFCSKCGKEIPDEARFCTGCGAQVGGERKNLTISEFRLDGLKKRIDLLGNCKVYFFGGILGLIISIFFLGAEMFEVSYQLWSTHTESFTMFEDKAFFKVLFILAYIVTAGILLMPLITGKEWEDWNFHPAFWVPIAAVVVLLLTMVTAKNGIKSDELMQVVDAKVKLSANGWLFIIINAVTALLVVKSGLAVAEAQDARQTQEEKKNSEKFVPYWCGECEAEGPFANDGACPRCGSKTKKFFKL